MSRRKNLLITNDEESTFELDLSPMLALMVTLIPVMLLATVFVRVTIIETKVPQVVQNAIEQDRKKKERDIQVKLLMQADKTFLIELLEDGRKKHSRSLKAVNGEWDLDNLHKELYSLKQQHTEIFRLDLFPDQEVKYDEIVKVMDEARNAKSEEKKFVINDKKTQQTAETDIMFPDVIFSNVIGG